VNGTGRLISKCRHVVIASGVSIGFADALDAFPACSFIPGFGGRNGCDPCGRISVALLMPEPLTAAVAIPPDVPEAEHPPLSWPSPETLEAAPIPRRSPVEPDLLEVNDAIPNGRHHPDPRVRPVDEGGLSQSHSAALGTLAPASRSPSGS
jgi:hypothetical protein